MAKDSKIEWCDHTFNPFIGCQKVSAGCANCLHPDTPILMADWSWREINGIEVGDRLLTFEEKPENKRRVIETKVEAKWETSKDAARIATRHGEIIVSLDHRFLIRDAKGAFREARRLRLGDKLRYVGMWPLYEETSDYMIGYIAGMTRGDGTFRFKSEWTGIPWKEHPQPYWRVALQERQRTVLETLARYFDDLKIGKLAVKAFNSGSTNPKHSPMLKVETRSKPILLSLLQTLEGCSRTIEYKRGWLAGIFDAEGSTGYKSDGRVTGRLQSLRICNTAGPVLDQIVEYGNALGFEFKIEKFSRRAKTVRLVGNSWSDRVRFLGTVQSKVDYKAQSVHGRQWVTDKSEIILLEQLGKMNLIDIQTGEGTFIAGGFMVHNCYAERSMTRKPRWANAWGPPETSERVRTKTWGQPISWNRQAEREGRRYKVFCASLADIFEDNPQVVEWRRELWRLIERTPFLDWLLLTKRPENIERMVPASWMLRGFPRNVWQGVTVENSDYLWRIEMLLKLPAVIHYVSVEPMLGPMDLGLAGTCPKSWDVGYRPISDLLHWVICGGESGPSARPMDPEWPGNLRDQCVEAGVPYFFKQWGEWAPLNQLSPEARRYYCLSEADDQGLLRPDVPTLLFPNGKIVKRVGRQRAGCMLDGREWNEMPERSG